MEAIKNSEQDERLLEILEELLPRATRHRGDRDDEEPVHQVLTRAEGAPRPSTTAPRSVFELAQGPEPGTVRAHRHNCPGSPSGFALSASAPPRRAVNTVARAGGVVRVSGLSYPGDRWTAEKAERERARRARQIPPRPSGASRNFRFGAGAVAQPQQ